MGYYRESQLCWIIVMWNFHIVLYLCVFVSVYCCNGTVFVTWECKLEFLLKSSLFTYFIITLMTDVNVLCPYQNKQNKQTNILCITSSEKYVYGSNTQSGTCFLCQYSEFRCQFWHISLWYIAYNVLMQLEILNSKSFCINRVKSLKRQIYVMKKLARSSWSCGGTLKKMKCPSQNKSQILINTTLWESNMSFPSVGGYCFVFELSYMLAQSGQLPLCYVWQRNSASIAVSVCITWFFCNLQLSVGCVLSL